MSADGSLPLGARMSLFYIFGDLFNQEAKIIQADIEAEEIGRNRSVDLPVVGDIQALLSLCNHLIDEKNLALGFQKRFEDWISYSYYVFALLFLLYMFDYIDRLVVVSLFPYLQKDWGLTDTQCGLMVSAVY